MLPARSGWKYVAGCGLGQPATYFNGLFDGAQGTGAIAAVAEPVGEVVENFSPVPDRASGRFAHHSSTVGNLLRARSA